MILTAVTFSILMSALFNKSASSICISIVILTGLYLLTYQMGVFDSFAQFNPISYLNITKLVSGTAAEEFINTDVTYINGLIVLAITSIICAFTSSKIFKKKDLFC